MNATAPAMSEQELLFDVFGKPASKDALGPGPLTVTEYLSPEPAIQTPILDGFAHMIRGDSIAAGEIGNGAGYC